MDLYVDVVTETLLFIDPNEMKTDLRMSDEEKIDVIHAIIFYKIMTIFAHIKKITGLE